MPKCRKKPAGEVTHEPIEVSCNESSLDSHSILEQSHNFKPNEELKQEVVGGKRLAEQPSEELESAIKEGPRPPKMPMSQVRKAVPLFEDRSLGAPTQQDIERVEKEKNQIWKEKL